MARKNSHSVGDKDEFTTAGRFSRIPLDAPPPRMRTKPRMPEAIRFMTMVVRQRQNALADFYDLQEVWYNWDELKLKWYPRQSGVYSPLQYVRLKPDE